MSVVELAARLPGIDTVRRWCVSLAVLDTIVGQEPEFRYFAFDASWSPSEELASMSNGSGDEYSIVFSDAGAYIRGFDHESPLSPWAQSPPAVVPGLVDALPAPFRPYVGEPAFGMEGVPAITVCMWRERSEPAWHAGRPAVPELADQPGGADWLFAQLDGRAETYAEFAEEYWEATLAPDDIRAVLEHRPLTAGLVRRLNTEADVSVVLAEARALTYPVSE